MTLRASTVILIALGGLDVGCRTPEPGHAQVKDLTATPGWDHLQTAAAPADIPPLSCDQGAPFAFMLALPMPPVTTADVTLPPRFFETAPLSLTAPSAHDNVRFDVCVDDTTDPVTAQLRRLVLVGLLKETSGAFNVVTLPASAASPELGKVLFGAPGAVRVRVALQTIARTDKTTVFSVEVRSWNVNGQAVVSVANLITNTNPDGSPQGGDIGDNAVVGKLVAGDPVVANPDVPQECGDAPAVVERFKIETAAFTARVCRNFIGTAGTHNYKIVGMAVTDDNAALPASARGKTFTLSGDDFKRNFAFFVKHHNVCDSFAMHLPHATYAATDAPFGEATQGCPASVVVPDAPTRDAADQSVSFYYRVRYGQGAWQQFVEPCGKSYETDCHAATP